MYLSSSLQLHQVETPMDTDSPLALSNTSSHPTHASTPHIQISTDVDCTINSDHLGQLTNNQLHVQLIAAPADDHHQQQHQQHSHHQQPQHQNQQQQHHQQQQQQIQHHRLVDGIITTTSSPGNNNSVIPLVTTTEALIEELSEQDHQQHHITVCNSSISPAITATTLDGNIVGVTGVQGLNNVTWRTTTIPHHSTTHATYYEAPLASANNQMLNIHTVGEDSVAVPVVYDQYRTDVG